MAMPVRVRLFDFGLGVQMLMMYIVIVQMFVLDRRVCVQVLMALCRERNHSDRHQARPDPIDRVWPLSKDRHCDQGADEWRRGKIGSLAGSSHQAHRFQCEDQTQAVTTCA